MDITCPSCKEILEVSEDLLGEIVECPACNNSIEIPKPTIPQTPAKKIFKPFKKNIPPSPNKPTASNEPAKTKPCPLCGEDILSVAIKCKHCGSDLKAEADKTKAHELKKKNEMSMAQGCGFVVFMFIVIIVYFILSGNSSSSAKAPKTLEQIRTERLQGGFDTWDGSHKGLTELIKKSMNDPNSYEHVKTTYQDHGDYLIVTTVFRGKNAFGGVVPNTVTAKTDIDGNVIKIISQE